MDKTLSEILPSGSDILCICGNNSNKQLKPQKWCCYYIATHSCPDDLLEIGRIELVLKELLDRKKFHEICEDLKMDKTTLIYAIAIIRCTK